MMLTSRRVLVCLGILTVACGPTDSPEPRAGSEPPAVAVPLAATSSAAEGAPGSPPITPSRPPADGAAPARSELLGAKQERAAAPVIAFLGTSLTAGLGVRSDQAYPALIGEKLRQAGFDLRVVNAGVSGDTSAGGLRRIDWLLRQPVRVLVIELGANDMLRGQDLDALASNLQSIVERARRKDPDLSILIAGMQAAPNLGADYGRAFEQTYADLARRNDAAYIPFLLEGVAANPELNQADGIHPNPAGHEIIAETVWKALQPLLGRHSQP